MKNKRIKVSTSLLDSIVRDAKLLAVIEGVGFNEIIEIALINYLASQDELSVFSDYKNYSVE